MKNGNLSNQVGITIGFRCEDFLIVYRESSFTDKVLNKLFGKEKRAEVDERVRTVMERLYRQSDYSVDLVIHRKNYTQELKNILDDLPFCRIVLIDKDVQISHRLFTGDLTFYIDDDPDRRSLINSKYAISLDELSNRVRWRSARND